MEQSNKKLTNNAGWTSSTQFRGGAAAFSTPTPVVPEEVATGGFGGGFSGTGGGFSGTGGGGGGGFGGTAQGGFNTATEPVSAQRFSFDQPKIPVNREPGFNFGGGEFSGPSTTGSTASVAQGFSGPPTTPVNGNPGFGFESPHQPTFFPNRLQASYEDYITLNKKYHRDTDSLRYTVRRVSRRNRELEQRNRELEQKVELLESKLQKEFWCTTGAPNSTGAGVEGDSSKKAKN